MEEKKCLNCGHHLSDEDLFCPRCGQKFSRTTGTVKDFFVDFLGDYFTFDSKIFRSLIPLILRPGFLTTEYLIGRRVRYIPPLRLYIFISIVFFLIFKFSNPFSGTVMNQENEMTQDIFDYFADNHWHKVFFILLPLFAVVIYLFYRKTYKDFLPHFIFSLHFHSFLLLLLSFYKIVISYIATEFYTFNKFFFGSVIIAYHIYLFYALNRVFNSRKGVLIIKGVVIAVIYFLLFSSVSVFSLAIYYLIKS